MNYAELAAAVASTTVNEFAPEDMARFAQLTEQKVYNAVQFPSLRKNVRGLLTSNVPYLNTPDDFLSVYSIAVMLPSGSYEYLLNKDVSYIRQVYPFPGAVGVPKCYAIYGAATTNDAVPLVTNELALILGPTPNASYQVELHYNHMPESVVTAGSTWLSENFSAVLLNGMLTEAARFMKEEPDVIAEYDKMFAVSLAQAQRLGDGLQRTDSYREPQAKRTVT